MNEGKGAQEFTIAQEPKRAYARGYGYPKEGDMIYEYRVYEATPGQMPTLVRVIEAAMPFFKKHGMTVMGCWTTQQTISDGSNKLIYLLAFNDLAHLERAWKAFRADPQWQEAHTKFTENGKVTYVSKFSNYTMAPTPYSPAQ